MKRILSSVFCVLFMAAPLFVWAQAVPDALVGTFELHTWQYGTGAAHGNWANTKGTMVVTSSQITFNVTHDMVYPNFETWRLLNRREREEQKKTSNYRVSGDTLTIFRERFKRKTG